MESDEKIADLQEHIHYRFFQVKHLRMALTHSSFANEQDMCVEHNERLEFLGDAVLELAISEELYARFPDSPEGQMTRMRSKLVREPTLAQLAREIGLDACLMLGRGEEIQGGRTRDSLLSDGLEALIGAVFLDGGYETAKTLVAGLFEGRWPESPEAPKAKDFKSLLQELTQRRYKTRPTYALVGSHGPEHAKRFEVRVELPGVFRLTAAGSSMKKAQQKAARLAIESIPPEGSLAGEADEDADEPS